jgi:ubiquinone biosynthesis protein Coq4
VMKESKEGMEILQEKPRINTTTVNLEELKKMPEESMGFHYWKFLEDNVGNCDVTANNKLFDCFDFSKSHPTRGWRFDSCKIHSWPT